VSPREQQALQFLEGKAYNIKHSGTSFYTHLYNTFCLLKSYNQSEDVCLAGLFHSIYGTEFFDANINIDEQEVIDIIGEYANSLVKKFSIDNRDENIVYNLLNASKQEQLDLLYMLYANVVEQSYRLSFEKDFYAKIKNRITFLENS
jgi:(p)ppGpp synthase/HD superfamily hydrolase